MITTTAAYPAALQDQPPLGQTGLTDASMNDNNNNNNNIHTKAYGFFIFQSAPSDKWGTHR